MAAAPHYDYTYSMQPKVYWKTFKGHGIAGEAAEFVPYSPDDTGLWLWLQIREMPLGKPIGLFDAFRMVQDAFRQKIMLGREVTVTFDTWVEWVAEQGYRIELDGSEFEIEGQIFNV